MTGARIHDGDGGSRVSSHAHAVLLSWGPTVLFGMTLPWITHHQLAGQGVPEAAALVLVSAWPALEIGLYFALHHRLDEFGTLVLAALLVAAAGAVVGGGRWTGGRTETAFTGLVGVTLAISLVFGRPLTFWFGRRFATDGSAAGSARWNGLWQQDAGFRGMHYRLTAAWASGCLAVACMTAVLPLRQPGGGVDAAALAAPAVVATAVVAYTARAGRAWAVRGQTPAAPSSAPTA
ncbi:VC0807 family protein [Actinacidiphila bryophytorum]|uniref:VC0807 family protein n=1 Tax=Actinacidiphila bryophytorum TaxID=1436133 RepID=UPI002AFDE897|nr:VC0807 family protein [Actinacidiphila bryophytorum]